MDPPAGRARRGPPSRPTASPAAPPAVELHPELVGLAAFVGVWTGGGEGVYPTISPFGYTERIELHPVPGKPLLAYRSATRATDDGRALHSESGFFRRRRRRRRSSWWWPRVRVWSRSPRAWSTATRSCSSRPSVRGTTTAKEVTATERRYRVSGDTLTYELAMAAVGQPLLPHLRAELHRSG